VLLENMHDIPYVQPKNMGPEVTAVMTRVCAEVRRVLPATVQCGVQV
jgi:predicted TIM-barrel enzyme